MAGKDEQYAVSKLVRRVEEAALTDFLKKLDETGARELGDAVVRAVTEQVAPAWRESVYAKERKAYYLSAEYLLGRMVYSNLFALDMLDDVSEALKKRGADIGELEDLEEAAVGNGGLGRLAACFLDSAATHGLPLMGYGIKYRYGLFRQKIENGFQVEEADDWKSGEYPWLYRRDEESVAISFKGQDVCAVPYDMPVIGYRSDRVNTLRLWQAEAPRMFDFQKFNNGSYAGAVKERDKAEMISAVLYPNDSTDKGKELRIRQEYFFSSASMQDILRTCRKKYGKKYIEQFIKNTAVQLNDTHPVVAIPETVRLLMGEGLSFEQAFAAARDIFSYTNHTIMSEALEKWDIRLFKKLLPNVYAVIEKINGRLHGEFGKCKDICELEILHEGQIHMARLAVYGSSHVNGVAKIHTEILKKEVLKAWYKRYPERFSNKTNGVTPRRWVALSDEGLATLVTNKIGDGWIKDFSQIKKIEPFIKDDAFVEEFNRVKHQNKVELAAYIKKRDGFDVNPDTVFDIQVKRLHEYKRQLLNAFGILDLYFQMKKGKLEDLPPASFIFGSKAAPSYERAKSIIKFINEVSRMIAADGDVNKRLAVYFVSNYDVPYAERLMPAADISEQISTAGTEASGTGNMKFMMNGAVTLGTLDGANVEIFKHAGLENNYKCGAELREIERAGNGYDPRKLYRGNERIRRVVDTLIDGTLEDGGTGMFRDIYHSLLGKEEGGMADQYKVLMDFEDYTEKKIQALRDYSDRLAFGRKCLYNIARSGYFSSDRCIKEYAEEIWRL